MLPLRIEICVSLLALTCGQILFWRRRDNVLGYLQVGLFLTTLLLPLAGTGLLEEFNEQIVELYAQILMIGSVAYLAGMCFGAPLGNRPARGAGYTFTLRPARLLNLIIVRGRVLAAIGVVALALGYILLGYAPLLAADRANAKFGVGVYQAGFQRGAIVYRFALAVAGAALPVALALLFRRRRLLDLTLIAGLTLGLVLSLSRTVAFSGVLLFLVALAIEKRVRPFFITLTVVVVFFIGALSNELFFPEVAQGSLIARAAASAPDIRDQLGFIRGFEFWGERRSPGALLAGLSLGQSDDDPSNYAVRTLTGFTNLQGIASGGLRLPAPVWGYASFGFFGAAGFGFLAGLFTGWGTTRLKRLLEPVSERPGSSLNLIVAGLFYAGTFGVLSTFYFATSSMFVQIAIALYVGRFLNLPSMRRGESFPEEAKQPESRVPVRLEGGRAVTRTATLSTFSLPSEPEGEPYE